MGCFWLLARLWNFLEYFHVGTLQEPVLIVRATEAEEQLFRVGQRAAAT